MQGAQAPALRRGNDELFEDDSAIAAIIKEGKPAKGMPAWNGKIADDDLAALVQFIKREREAASSENAALSDRKKIKQLPRESIHSELDSFRIKPVAETGKPTGLAVLPDGRVLVSQESGELGMIGKDGSFVNIKQVPDCHPQDFFKRGILGVALHPAYRSNGWIYLTCANTVSDGAAEPVADITLVRGRLKGITWVDSQVLTHLVTETSVAGPIAFDGAGHVFLTTASAAGLGTSPDSKVPGNEPVAAAILMASPPQDVRDPNGKILRYDDDGSIPADNPFLHTPGAYPAIWSLGVRNAEGLAFDFRNRRLWATDHGPRGGDKVNLIIGAHNYGWPVISYGTRYDGVSFTKEDSRDGMDQPVVTWTPDIGISAIAVYSGSYFPRWDGNLLVGSLATQQLIRIGLAHDKAVVQEVLVDHIGRVRAIAVGNGGEVYIALELEQQGIVVRLIH